MKSDRSNDIPPTKLSTGNDANERGMVFPMSADQSIVSAAGRHKREEVRDISGDLLERLEAARSDLALTRTEYEVEKRELEARFTLKYQKTSERIKALEVLLDGEAGCKSHKDLLGDNATRLPMQDFILNLLEDNVYMRKDDIRDAVERAGYVRQGETAGRQVHFTLVNLFKAGRVMKSSDDLHYTKATANVL